MPTHIYTLIDIMKRKEKRKKEKGESQHMDSCMHVYEPVLLYKL